MRLNGRSHGYLEKDYGHHAIVVDIPRFGDVVTGPGQAAFEQVIARYDTAHRFKQRSTKAAGIAALYQRSRPFYFTRKLAHAVTMNGRW
jgi:hypothetical protein